MGKKQTSQYKKEQENEQKVQETKEDEYILHGKPSVKSEKIRFKNADKIYE